MGNRYELVLESDLSEVRRVEGFVKKMCQEHRFAKDFAQDLMLVITEATNNAIIHGNKFDKAKRATLFCSIENEEVLIEVRDEGVGFDPAELPNPLAEENLLKPSGRGVFLMRRFAKHIEYVFSPTGTTLKIRLPIRRSERADCG